MTEDSALAERVARLEEQMARLESTRSSVVRVGAEGLDADAFWALEGLKERSPDPGAVLFTGAVTLPAGEHYEWQNEQGVEALLADDWSQAASAIAALGHPVRLLLLREILHGARTVTELGTHEQLGTSGQLYHHLRQLVAAGWLRTTSRGQYAVPPERVIPLLTVLAAARR